MIETFDLGDIVQMKKQHPCGSKEFEVIRLGADTVSYTHLTLPTT